MSHSSGTLPRVRRRLLTATEPSSQTSNAQEPRYYALDALRATAMLLGIVLHAAISYMPCRMPHLLWAIHDRATAAWLDWLFWGIHAFRMPLFFLLSGFFAALLHAKRGGEAFLLNRCRRVLGPLVLACLVILPLVLVVWCVGWLVSGECTSGQVLRLKFRADLQEGVYGLGHLWFLEHLFLLCLGLWAFEQLHSRGHVLIRWCDAFAPWRDRVMHSRLKPLWLALPSAVVATIDPTAAVDFDQPFLPQPGRFLYYSTFFVAGVWLYRQRERLQQTTANYFWYLLAAAPVFVSLGLLLRLEISAALPPIGRAALALDHSLVAWLMSLGLLGLFLRVLNRASPVVRYISDASYYTYLVHMPLVAAVQIVLYPLSWSPEAKFFTAATVPTLLCLISYQDLARGTWLGELLMGRREPVSPATRHRAAWYLAIPLVSGVLALCGLRYWWPFFADNNIHTVAPERAYRSAMLKPHELDELLGRHQIRSVVCLQAGHDEFPWFSAQKKTCFARRTQLFPLDLPEDALPAREQLEALITVIDHAPRPMLLEGRFGFGRAALASAATVLLAGGSVESALDQFHVRYGLWNGTPGSTEKVIRAYDRWLIQTQQQHSPALFRQWSSQHYRPWDLAAGRS